MAISALPDATRCQVLIDPNRGQFTVDLSAYHLGKGIMEVHRWHDTPVNNKLGP